MSTTERRARLDAVDWLRGLVMVVMALDHSRDFFSNVRFSPTDLTQATTILFLTRWIASVKARRRDPWLSYL